MIFRMLFCALFVARACGLEVSSSYDGLARRPMNNKSVIFKKMVPEPLTEIVDAHLIKELYCTGTLAKLHNKINYHQRQQLCNQIVAKLAAELTTHLKLYINDLLAEWQIPNEPDDAFVNKLNTVQDNVGVLSGLLGFLYDNGAELTELMDTYLLLSDIATVYVRSSSKDNFVNALRDHSCKLSDQTTDVVHRELFKNNNVFYQLANTDYYRQPKLWMMPITLKWKLLMEFKSEAAELFKQKVAEGNELNFQQRYEEIIAETDSVKVFTFYTQVADAITDMLVDAATEIVSDFIQLLGLLASTKGLSSGQTKIHVGTAFSIVTKLTWAAKTFVRYSSDDYHLTRPGKKLGKSFEAVLENALLIGQTDAKDLSPENMKSKAASLKEAANNILKIHSHRSEIATVEGILEDMRKASRQIEAIIEIIKPDLLYGLFKLSNQM